MFAVGSRKLLIPGTAVFLSDRLLGGENYFIEMGWKIGSGTGDVKVTVALMNTQEGMKAVKESRLISSDGY